MTDRGRIRVVVDGVDEYPDAKAILVKLGVTSSAERTAIRDQLRRVGHAEVVFRGRTYVIEAIPRSGLFAGVDEAISRAFHLKDGMHLGQLGTSLKVASSPVRADEIVDLVRHLYGQVSKNCGKHTPSKENWRWELQTHLDDANESAEVVLERSIALLAKKHLPGWCNQIPVASGLVNPRSDKRAAVDLARITRNRLDLYELKLESDNPVYAAFEILQYGLAYLLCRVNKSKFGYAHLPTMKVNALGLNVLAPRSYYKGFDLDWLEAGLDAGIRAVSQDQCELEYGASFRFVTLPDMTCFPSGAEAKAACGATPPVVPEALDLVRAMSTIAPFRAPSGSD